MLGAARSARSSAGWIHMIVRVGRMEGRREKFCSKPSNNRREGQGTECSRGNFVRSPPNACQAVYDLGSCRPAPLTSRRRPTPFPIGHSGIQFDAIHRGGMLPYAAMRLRRLARAATALGNDPTDYSISYTASDYVSYYSQRLSSACVLNGARGVLKGVAKMRAKRRIAAKAT